MNQNSPQGRGLAYLSTKNLMFVFVSFIAVVFICPGCGPFYWDQDSGLFSSPMIISLFAQSVVFYPLMWTFPSIVKRNWKKVLILTILCWLNFIVVGALGDYNIMNNELLMFIHPFTLSICSGFLYQKNYKFAIISYFLCLSFVQFGLIGIIIVILFFQLLMSHSLFPSKQTLLSAFITRLYFYISMTIIYTFMHYVTIGDGDFSLYLLECILVVIFGLGTMYWLLFLYLRNYYKEMDWRYYLSFIPVLWLIPMFAIFFEKRENVTVGIND